MSFTFLFVLLSYATIEIKHILLVKAASSDDLIFSVVGLQNTHPNTHIAHIIFNFNIFDLRRPCDLTRYIHVAAGTTATAILSLFIHFFFATNFFFRCWMTIYVALCDHAKMKAPVQLCCRSAQLSDKNERQACNDRGDHMIDRFLFWDCML